MRGSTPDGPRARPSRHTVAAPPLRCCTCPCHPWDGCSGAAGRHGNSRVRPWGSFGSPPPLLPPRPLLSTFAVASSFVLQPFHLKMFFSNKNVVAQASGPVCNSHARRMQGSLWQAAWQGAAPTFVPLTCLLHARTCRWCGWRMGTSWQQLARTRQQPRRR